MSEEHLNPNRSPDGFSGAPGGVRRMNKLPIILVAVLAGIIIIALVYATEQRANKGNRQAVAAEAAPVQTRSTQSAANALLQSQPLDGTIAPATPTATPAVATAPPVARQATAANTAPPASDRSAPPARRTEQSDAEERRQQRARQFREDMFYDAVVSNTGLQSRGGSQGGSMQGTNGAAPRGAEGLAGERDRRISEAMRLAGLAGGGGAGGGGAGSGSLPFFGGSGGEDADPNLRGRKDEFQQTQRTYGYSSEFRRSQLTPYELRVGTVIPSVMIGGINSDLPGEIIAQVSQNVRDTRTGQHVLIPQGSRLIGTYDSHVAMGQRRVMVAWHRVQFPDGSTLELGNMGGTDMAGYAGFNDKVNNHYWRIFGNATLLSLIGAGAQLSQPTNSGMGTTGTNAREELAAELGRQWGQVGQQMIRRNMNIQPTLEIRPGYQFNVMVNKDLILEPYQALPTGR